MGVVIILDTLKYFIIKWLAVEKCFCYNINGSQNYKCVNDFKFIKSMQ